MNISNLENSINLMRFLCLNFFPLTLLLLSRVKQTRCEMNFYQKYYIE